MNKPSPFPTAAKTVRRNITEIDPDLLVVEHDTKMPVYRSRSTDKYAVVFGKLKPGSCVRCQPSEKDRVANALRKAIDTGKLAALSGCRVVSRTGLPDGHARVWAMPAETAEAVAQKNQRSSRRAA